MKQRLRSWSWIDRWFPWVVLGGGVVGLAIAVRGQWDAISALDWSGSWRVLLASAALFAFAPLAQAFTFWIVLRLLGASSSLAEALVIWAHSYVLRYAPTGALAVVYRIRERDRLAATREQILSAEAYEHLGSIPAGAGACVLAFLALGTVASWLGLARSRCRSSSLPSPSGPRQVGADPPAAFWHRRADPPPTPPGARDCCQPRCLDHNGPGISRSPQRLSDEPSPGLVWAIATYSVGFLVGFVVPYLPGGLGAREGTTIAVLAPRYGAGAATGIALAARLAVTLGEALAIGIIWLGLRPERRVAEADELRRRADLSGASLHYPCCEPE